MLNPPCNCEEKKLKKDMLNPMKGLRDCPGHAGYEGNEAQLNGHWQGQHPKEDPIVEGVKFENTGGTEYTIKQMSEKAVASGGIQSTEDEFAILAYNTAQYHNSIESGVNMFQKLERFERMATLLHRNYVDYQLRQHLKDNMVVGKLCYMPFAGKTIVGLDVMLGMDQ